MTVTPDVDKDKAARDPKSPHRRRRIRALLKSDRLWQAELKSLEAEEAKDRANQRREDDTRRKTLAGLAVLNRVLRQPGLISLLRRLLDLGLTRAADRSMFNLDYGPLIPEEDWPEWSAPRSTDVRDAASPRPRTPGRRRARIAYLENKRAAAQQELKKLMEQDAPERDNRNTQRKILVGAVFLNFSLVKKRVAKWLRRLLDAEFSEARDRRLFQLKGDGPLVPEEDQTRQRLHRRRAPKTRTSDDGSRAADRGARRSRSASDAKRTSGTGSTAAASAVGSSKQEPADDEAAAADVQAPIPDWQPTRVHGQSAGGLGKGKRNSEWGAKLTGKAAVAALPVELRGRTITVVDSNLNAWTTTITDIVSRDERCVIVRNSGRPSSVERRPARPNRPVGRRPDAAVHVVDPNPRSLGPTAADVAARAEPGEQDHPEKSRTQSGGTSHGKNGPTADTREDTGHRDSAHERAC